jgi:hypothetical protein
LENLIPTPKDTTERQKIGIFGWSLEKAPFGAKIQIQIFMSELVTNYCPPFENF